MEDLRNLFDSLFRSNRKIDRFWFNVVLFVAFLPVLFIHLYTFNTVLGEVTDMASSSNGLNDALREISRYNGDTNITSTSDSTSSNFNFADILNNLIYVIIIPLFVMRLRDIAMSEYYVILVYLPMIFSLFSFIIPISAWLTVPANIVSFLLVTYLATVKSVHK